MFGNVFVAIFLSMTIVIVSVIVIIVSIIDVNVIGSDFIIGGYWLLQTVCLLWRVVARTL